MYAVGGGFREVPRAPTHTLARKLKKENLSQPRPVKKQTFTRRDTFGYGRPHAIIKTLTSACIKVQEPMRQGSAGREARRRERQHRRAATASRSHRGANNGSSALSFSPDVHVNPTAQTERKSPRSSRRASLHLCFACHKSIVDKQCLKVDHRRFHLECFRCAVCGTDLVKSSNFHLVPGAGEEAESNGASAAGQRPGILFKGASSAARGPDERLLCDKDYLSEFGKTCRTCGQVLPAKTQVVVACGAFYHAEHFVCHTCKKPFPKGQYFEYETYPYCDEHFRALTAVHCAACDEPVTGRHAKLDGHTYHAECVRCTRCLRSIPDQIVTHDDNVYCKQDHAYLYAKRWYTSFYCRVHRVSSALSHNFPFSCSSIRVRAVFVGSVHSTKCGRNSPVPRVTAKQDPEQTHKEFYHMPCVKCEVCGIQLEAYVCVAGMLRCEEHSEERMSDPMCSVCRQCIDTSACYGIVDPTAVGVAEENILIRSVGFVVHPWCFCCCFCSASLTHQTARRVWDAAADQTRLGCKDCIQRLPTPQEAKANARVPRREPILMERRSSSPASLSPPPDAAAAPTKKGTHVVRSIHLHVGSKQLGVAKSVRGSAAAVGAGTDAAGAAGDDRAKPRGHARGTDRSLSVDQGGRRPRKPARHSHTGSVPAEIFSPSSNRAGSVGLRLQAVTEDDVIPEEPEATTGPDVKAQDPVLSPDAGSNHSSSPNRSPTSPRAIGSYQKGDLLGKGGFGKVYRAIDLDTAQQFAIKEIEIGPSSASEPAETKRRSSNPTDTTPSQVHVSQASQDPPSEHASGNSGGAAARERKLKDFEHEVQLMQRLHHPNIVLYLGFAYVPAGAEGPNVPDSPRVRLFLELCIDSLVNTIKRFGGSLKEPIIRKYTEEILLGLVYLHSHNIVHRDIKGANILFGMDGHVKLADFGIARPIDTLAESRARSIVGTPFWMAPEVMKETGYDQKADIWSVGCVAVEMLTGKHPFPNLTQFAAIFRISQGKAPPYPTVSPLLQDFLNQCFIPDPNRRLSASELLQHPFITGQSPQ